VISSSRLVGGQAMAGEHTGDRVVEIGVVEVPGGEIGGQAAVREAGGAMRCHLRAAGLEHPAADLVDDPGLFG
jgi:hypothetical protein